MTTNGEVMNDKVIEWPDAPLWINIHVTMIQAIATAFSEDMGQEAHGDKLSAPALGALDASVLKFYVMTHKDTGEKAYSIYWGDSRFVYVVSNPGTLEIFDMAKTDDGSMGADVLADVQPEFGDDPKSVVSFLVDATRHWLLTGEAQHFHCEKCEEESAAGDPCGEAVS